MPHRKLTESEMKLIHRLLEKHFPGRDAIAEQLNTALVEPIDANGSLKVFVNSDVNTVTEFRIPAEGEVEDIDGTTIHLLLHIVNGKVDELEVYKDDGSAVIKMPDPKHLRLFYPHGEVSD